MKWPYELKIKTNNVKLSTKMNRLQITCIIIPVFQIVFTVAFSFFIIFASNTSVNPVFLLSLFWSPKIQ